MALISIISFLGVTAAVALLICTMAIMNGFRSDLLSRIVGFQDHIYIQGPAIENASRDALVARLRKIPGVVQVAPKVETQTLVLANGDTQGAIVRGVTPETLRDTPLVAQPHPAGLDGRLRQGRVRRRHRPDRRPARRQPWACAPATRSP